METVKKTIAQNFGGAAQDVSSSKFDIDKDVPDLRGKVAVVTGGSEGIGYAASFVMLRAGLKKLFVISLSKEIADGASKDIAEKLGQEYADKVTWIQMDMGEWQTAAETANKIASQTDRLDILILNAARGIMTYELSKDGVDRHMAVNHVGHVTLCSHFLPLMKKTAKANPKDYVRIHIQSSNAHPAAPSDTKFASLDELNQDLGPNGQYGRSKLAAILYVRYLTRHLTSEYPNILANATHPGFVETKMSTKEIHEPYPILGYGMSTLMSPFKKDQWEGSASTLFAATKTTGSGQYICPPAAVEEGSKLSQDPELGEQLMKLTRQLVGDKYGPQSVGKGCPLKDY